VRLLVTALAASLFATPAAAEPKVGERTITPEKLLESFGPGSSNEEVDEAVAAAAAFPLGSAQNPVRVGGPEGERAYIARLKCADGSRPQVGQRSSAGTGAFGSIVDAYPLDCGAAAPGRTTIVMDMYHDEHREDRAPAGFTIDPR
jgi:hypothetical protein